MRQVRISGGLEGLLLAYICTKAESRRSRIVLVPSLKGVILDSHRALRTSEGKLRRTSELANKKTTQTDHLCKPQRSSPSYFCYLIIDLHGEQRAFDYA